MPRPANILLFSSATPNPRYGTLLAIEVVSPGNANHDYITKLAKYQQAGVREYWIINPETAKTLVMNFENPASTGEYEFEEKITSGVLEGLEICIKELLENF